MHSTGNSNPHSGCGITNEKRKIIINKQNYFFNSSRKLLAQSSPNVIRHISYGSPTNIVHTKFFMTLGGLLWGVNYVFSFKHLLHQNYLSHPLQIYYGASPMGPQQKSSYEQKLIIINKQRKSTLS